jgi:hypothetical protein
MACRRIIEGEKLIKKVIYMEREDIELYEKWTKLKKVNFGEGIRTVMKHYKKTINDDIEKQKPKQQPTEQKPVDDNPFVKF